jgi:hypothetical protein
MSPWLKAGLVGAVIIIVLNLMGLIPCVGLVTCFLGLLAYAGIGALAAYWMPPIRDAGQGAGQGALAALVAALLGGIVNTIASTIQMAVVDTSAVLSQVPPEALQQLQEAGIDPALFAGPSAGLLAGSMCCVGGLFLSAILGAIGGVILAAVKPE